MAHTKLPKLFAHRGASQFAPENTQAAFKKAAEMGATWVETDVMLTQDNVPILNHDDTFARTANTLAYVSDTPYSFVKTLDVGSWFSPEFKDERVPTLQAALQFLQEYHLSLNLEIKPTPGRDEETARIAIETLLASNFPKENLLVTSFSLPALRKAQSLAPHLNYGWIADIPKDLNIGIDSGLTFISMGIAQKEISPEIVDGLKAKGYQVLTYTVNDRLLAERLFEMGVDGVFSDNPALLSQNPRANL